MQDGELDSPGLLDLLKTIDDFDFDSESENDTEEDEDDDEDDEDDEDEIKRLEVIFENSLSSQAIDK